MSFSFTPNIRLDFNVPIFNVLHSKNSQSGHSSLIEDNNLIEALEKNTRAKIGFTHEYYLKYADSIRKKDIQDENKAIDKGNEIIRKEIDELAEENQNWFVNYEGNIQKLEEFFKKRKNFLERYYEELRDTLNELNLQEMLLDNKIFDLEEEKKNIEMERISLNQQSYYLKLSESVVSDVCSYMLIILIILLLF